MTANDANQQPGDGRPPEAPPPELPAAPPPQLAEPAPPTGQEREPDHARLTGGLLLAGMIAALLPLGRPFAR